jgi:predicted deacylase
MLVLSACTSGVIAQNLPDLAPRATAAVLPAPWTPTPVELPAPTPAPTTASESTATVFATGPNTIGYSVAGQPLEMYRFGHGPNPYLIVAGIHGGYEWNTIALAHELIEHLREHPELIPRRISLYILPSFNVDGEARSHSYAGRANENGADLNRNWPSRWQADWPKAGCWSYLPIHGGTGPASEPEVVWLMDFILRNRIEAIISYHSAALGIFPGGQPPLPESVSLADAIAEVAPYPYPPIEAGCLYTGQFADWAADQDIPAIDVELTNHSDTDFEINLPILEAFVNWRP